MSANEHTMSANENKKKSATSSTEGEKNAKAAAEAEAVAAVINAILGGVASNYLEIFAGRCKGSRYDGATAYAINRLNEINKMLDRMVGDGTAPTPYQKNLAEEKVKLLSILLDEKE